MGSGRVCGSHTLDQYNNEEGRNEIIDAPDVNVTVEDEGVDVETVRAVKCNSVDDPVDEID
jgi:hypothetical protein